MAGTEMLRSEAVTVDDLLAQCEQLGLGPASPGYALVRRLAEATESQWKDLVRLLAEGQATLLLPVWAKAAAAASSSPSASKDDGGPALHPPPSLAFAQDHLLFGPASRPTLTSDGSDKGFATLSGLRGSLAAAESGTPRGAEDESGEADSSFPPQKLFIKTFINRTDRGWAAQLSSVADRRNLFTTFALLPEACCPDYPYPNYTIVAQSTLRFPHTHTSSLHHRRSSGTFAQLFGGASRANRKAVTSPIATQPFVDSDPFESTDEETSRGLTLVWLIDRPLRRSRAIRGMTYSVQARLRTQLQRQADIRPEIGEVIGSFAGAFYPPVESFNRSMDSPARRGGESGGRKHNLPSMPNSPVTPKEWQTMAMFSASPQEVSTSYQDVIASVHAQLQADQKTPGGDVDELKVLEQVELIEELFVEEVHDRLLSPPQASDRKADDNLASRIAALHILGLDWEGLGLQIPSSETYSQDAKGQSLSRSDSRGSFFRQGLQRILEECHNQLHLLYNRAHMAPRRKLDVLVAVHRIIVDGLDKLPPIALQEDEQENREVSASAVLEDSREREEASDTLQAPQSPQLPRENRNTSSADLILPVLIRLIVLTNPPALASQLAFIQRYRYRTLLQNGEAAYCLINFQAAVQFIENAKPAELGLEGSVFPDFSNQTPTMAAGDVKEKTAAIEILRRVEKDDSDQANNDRNARSLPIGGRLRGLTGVVNSSFSVLGRVIGSGASAGMEAWDRSSKNLENVRAVDDIRGLLHSSVTRTTGVGGNLVSKIVEMERQGNEGEGQGARASRHSGVRSINAPKAPISPHRAASDYASTAGKLDAGTVGPTAMEVSSSRDSAKLSLSDRLANLNWKFSASAVTPLTHTDKPAEPVNTSTGILPSIANDEQGTILPNSSHFPMPSSITTLQPLLSTYSPAQSAVTLASSEVNAATPPPIPASLRSPYPPLSMPPTKSRPLHIVLAASGSVASIKLPLIVERLLRFNNVRVQVIATKAAQHFFAAEQIEKMGKLVGEEGEYDEGLTSYGSDALSEPYTVFSLAAENAAAGQTITRSPVSSPLSHLWTDEDEWTSWRKVGEPILHIELRRWTDVVIVAPCSANTLAKIASGICDNLLTSFLRALSSSTPTILYPAMNTLMYTHPLTARHLDVIKNVIGYDVKGPIEKRLACGDLGTGAMVEWTDIVSEVVGRFGLEERNGGGLAAEQQETEAN